MQEQVVFSLRFHLISYALSYLKIMFVIVYVCFIFYDNFPNVVQ